MENVQQSSTQFKKLLSNRLQASMFCKSGMYNNFKGSCRVSTVNKSSTQIMCNEDFTQMKGKMITQISNFDTPTHQIFSPSASKASRNLLLTTKAMNDKGQNYINPLQTLYKSNENSLKTLSFQYSAELDPPSPNSKKRMSDHHSSSNKLYYLNGSEKNNKISRENTFSGSKTDLKDLINTEKLKSSFGQESVEDFSCQSLKKISNINHLQVQCTPSKIKNNSTTEQSTNNLQTAYSIDKKIKSTLFLPRASFSHEKTCGSQSEFNSSDKNQGIQFQQAQYLWRTKEEIQKQSIKRFSDHSLLPSCDENIFVDRQTTLKTLLEDTQSTSDSNKKRDSESISKQYSLDSQKKPKQSIKLDKLYFSNETNLKTQSSSNLNKNHIQKNSCKPLRNKNIGDQQLFESYLKGIKNNYFLGIAPQNSKNPHHIFISNSQGHEPVLEHLSHNNPHKILPNETENQISQNSNSIMTNNNFFGNNNNEKNKVNHKSQMKQNVINQSLNLQTGIQNIQNEVFPHATCISEESEKKQELLIQRIDLCNDADSKSNNGDQVPQGSKPLGILTSRNKIRNLKHNISENQIHKDNLEAINSPHYSQQIGLPLNSKELIERSEKFEEIDNLIVSMKGQVEELQGMYNSDIQLVNIVQKIPGYNDLIHQIIMKEHPSHELRLPINLEISKEIILQYLFDHNLAVRPVKHPENFSFFYEQYEQNKNIPQTSQFAAKIGDLSHLSLESINEILKKIVYFCRSLDSIVVSKRQDHKKMQEDDLKTEIKQISAKTQQQIKNLYSKVPLQPSVKQLKLIPHQFILFNQSVQEFQQIQGNISHILERKNYIKKQPFIEYFEGFEENLGKFKKVSEHSRVQAKGLNDMNDILRDFSKYI